MICLITRVEAQTPENFGVRLALIVGNSQYREAPLLPNTPNDARDIGASLTDAGFQVTTLIDAGKAAFETALEDFARAATTADVVLFYYAGHAVQIGGRNLLIHPDARLRSEQDLYDWSHSTDDITAAIGDAAKTRLIILDACRDNPFGGAANPELRSLAGRSGLARVASDVAGNMIIYATQPNNVALDGEGDNSPFAQAFIEKLQSPGLDISAMMIEVRKAVIAATEGRQVPFVDSSLVEQFYFRPTVQLSSAEVSESALWEIINFQNDPRLLEAYLERFPDGRYVEQARGLIGELTISAADLNASYGDPARISLQGAVSGTGVDEEEVLWDLARDGRNAPLLEIYLSRYPDGAHSAEARQLLSNIRPLRTEMPDSGLLCQRLALHPRDGTAEAVGVEAKILRQDPLPAINACRRAVAEAVETPLYSALLARGLYVAGRKEEAIGLYESAAERGDARAMFTLGLMYASGDVVPKNDVVAARYYERASAAGSTDAMVNLAVALFRGTGVDKNIDRALSMFEAASVRGVSEASFNLASLFDNGIGGTKERALDLYIRAGEQGYLPGFLKAAAMLDKGAGVGVDTARAADLLVKGIGLGDTQVTDAFAETPGAWSSATRRAVQRKLQEFGYYTGAIDGQIGPGGKAAIERLRTDGPPS